MRLMSIAPPLACDLRQRRFAGDILPSEACARDPIPTPRSQEARSRPDPAHGADERFSRSV